MAALMYKLYVSTILIGVSNNSGYINEGRAECLLPLPSYNIFINLKQHFTVYVVLNAKIAHLDARYAKISELKMMGAKANLVAGNVKITMAFMHVHV